MKIIRGLWNDDFIRVLENFPLGLHDDEVDALWGAHGILSRISGAGFTRVEAKSETGANGFNGRCPLGRLCAEREGAGLKWNQPILGVPGPVVKPTENRVVS